MGGAPSRFASLRASAVNEPVVMMVPLPALAAIALRESLTSDGVTELA